MNKDATLRKWNEFLNMPFPEIGNEELQFKLTSIDSYSAGCITRYFDGKLDQECINILKQSSEELFILVKLIRGKEKAYFTLLNEIIESVIECVEV